MLAADVVLDWIAAVEAFKELGEGVGSMGPKNLPHPYFPSHP